MVALLDDHWAIFASTFHAREQILHPIEVKRQSS